MEIDIERELDTVARRAEDTRAEAEQRVRAVGPVTGTAATGDGGVSVVVRPGGLLAEVVLTPRALTVGAEALAAQIMAVAERATRRAGATMHATLSPVLGPAGERDLASLGYQPIDDDEDEAFDSPLGPRENRRAGR